MESFMVGLYGGLAMVGAFVIGSMVIDLLAALVEFVFHRAR